MLTHKEVSICLWPPSSRLIALQNSSPSTKVYGLKNVQHTVFPPRYKTTWSLLGDQSIFSHSANPQNMIFLSLITWNSSHSCWCLAEENSGGFKPTLFSCSGRKARRNGDLYGRGPCLTWLMKGRHCTTLPAIWLNRAFKNRVLRNTRTPSLFFWQDCKITQRSFSCTCKSFHNMAEKDAIKKGLCNNQLRNLIFTRKEIPPCITVSKTNFFFFFLLVTYYPSLKFHNKDLWQALLEFWLLF